jgi:ATP-dependent RNA helicase DeaD
LNTFKDLGLSERLLKVLPELGIETPTPIQNESIPLLALANKDFIGLAQTGTGKTAAYGLPLIDNIKPDLKQTQALILTPTRELGQQVAQHINAFAKYFNDIHAIAVYGGASISEQIKALKNKPQIVVATPGRLIDLIERKAIKIDKINIVILDEADEMLNMGFKEDIDNILSYTPEEKLTWLFSATMPTEIKRIVSKYMDNPNEITVNAKKEINENIEHQYCVVKSTDKTEALKRFLDLEKNMSAIIFCRTKLSAQDLAENLKKAHYHVDALHGDLSQNQRDVVMRRFKAHTLQVIVATDVAARGIDVDNLTHVIHYTLPDETAYYTHRSGRTARAGKKGISLSLVSTREMGRLNKFEKELKVKFIKTNVPNVKDIQLQNILNWTNEILEVDSSLNLDKTAYEQAELIFANTDKSELIKKLVNKQIQKLNYSHKDGDLNDKDKSSGTREKVRKDSSNSPSTSTSSQFETFFINVGRIDEISKKDLLEMICEVAKIRKNDIGEIEMQKSISFFEIDRKYSKKVIPSFQGMEHNGRKLRVNNDTNRPPKPSRTRSHENETPRQRRTKRSRK